MTQQMLRCRSILLLNDRELLLIIDCITRNHVDHDRINMVSLSAEQKYTAVQRKSQVFAPSSQQRSPILRFRVDGYQD